MNTAIKAYSSSPGAIYRPCASSRRTAASKGKSRGNILLYIDLATRWLRKATLDEFVIHETRVPAMGEAAAGQTIRNYKVRHLTVRMISREDYESSPG